MLYSKGSAKALRGLGSSAPGKKQEAAGGGGGRFGAGSELVSRSPVLISTVLVCGQARAEEAKVRLGQSMTASELAAQKTTKRTGGLSDR